MAHSVKDETVVSSLVRSRRRMNLQNLSSNWKHLQQKLKVVGADERRNTEKLEYTAENPDVSVKKKIQTESRRPVSARSNKRKRHNQSTPAMGGYISSLTSSYEKIDGSSASQSVEPLEKNGGSEKNEHPASLDKTVGKLGRFIAIDCEMVGTTDPTPFSIKAHQQAEAGPPEFSIVARATLVNYNQEVIYDSYVLPPAGVRVTNFRTEYSGISKEHLDPKSTFKAKDFVKVQQDVASFIKGRILVGHALRNDLEILGLTHPAAAIRDTSRYPKFRQLSAVPGKQGRLGKGRTPALRVLASDILHWDIQAGGKAGHDSAEDARAAMALFVLEKKGFEEEAVKRFGTSALRNQGMSTAAKPSSFVARSIGELNQDSAVKGGQSGESEDEEDNTATDGHPKKKKKKKKKKSRTKR